jgi:hypothetical protein
MCSAVVGSVPGVESEDRAELRNALVSRISTSVVHNVFHCYVLDAAICLSLSFGGMLRHTLCFCPFLEWQDAPIIPHLSKPGV